MTIYNPLVNCRLFCFVSMNMHGDEYSDPGDSIPVSAAECDPERWVDDHADFLYRFALLRVRHRETAEDLVQETLLAALQSRDGFGGRSSERTWLCGILKNKVFDHFRKLGRETAMTDVDSLADEFAEKFVGGGWIHLTGPQEWRPEADEVAHREEFWATLRRCLGRVPERVAQVFVLREVEGVSIKEISALARVSENNLGVMLHRARMALRECLEIHWFGSSSHDKK
jgi:RNA polymerase sigma-70 factor (ECF subfamily)